MSDLVCYCHMGPNRRRRERLILRIASAASKPPRLLRLGCGCLTTCRLAARGLLESWTTLCYLAGRFPEFTFGSGVLCQAYRNPALVAKMAATFQFLDGGRLFGLGRGGREDEFHAYNYPFPAPGQRVSELEEAIRVIKLMWAEEEATFEGQYYQVHNARCEPRPSPPPPILIGAHHPRMLHIAARMADWWDVTGSAIGRADYPGLSAEMDRVLKEVGRDPGTIRRSFSGPCLVSTSQEEIEQFANRMPRRARDRGHTRSGG